MSKKFLNRLGLSLVEMLIALSVGSILIIGATSIIVPSIRGNAQANKIQVSSALGKELLDGVSVFGEAGWHNVSYLATTSANKYFIVSASSPFSAATGTEGIVTDGMTSGLVGYWKLDESAGTITSDFSGNRNSGTLTNSPTFSSSCKVSGCRSFNGSSAYVTVPVSSTINFGNSDLSLSLWFNTPATSANQGFIRKGSAPFNLNGTGWEIRSRNANPLEFCLSNGSGTCSALNLGSVPQNSWTHVVVTHKRSTGLTSGYIDGSLVATTTLTTGSYTDSYALEIGKGNDGYYSGTIDDVRIYNRILSATEAQTIYAGAIYTRYFYIDNVGRDGSGAILSSGGTNDPSTKKVTVVYGWASGPTSSFSTYLTRYVNRVFDQTDWSGGPGQDTPITNINNKFSTSTSINYSTTTGSIIMQLQ
ncbi:MAG: LamG-like jellyroll fold domain-containing protein [Patescibacteria group bacterium]